MSEHKRLWQRIRHGHLQNVRFSDFEKLLEETGWAMDRREGSHRVFRHPRVPERLSVQPDRNGQAKPYQIREFRRYVEDYDLSQEGQ
jgi:predicted RNA binding protein YcfA (HicA-like mRNA interferase family)